MKTLTKKKQSEIGELFVSLGVGVRSIFLLLYNLINEIFILFRVSKRKPYSYTEVVNCLGSLTPRQFEFFCGEMFKQMGYKNVKVTQSSNDKGRDIVMQDKDGETVFVECKYYKHQPIGREISQKLLGSAVQFNVNKCIIVTTSTFHANAYEVKRQVGDKLELIDISKILTILRKMDSDSYRSIIMKSKNAA